MGLPLEDLAYVQFGGSLGSESWITGCWFKCTGIGTPIPSDFNTALTAIDLEIAGIWTDFLKGWNASGLVLNTTKLHFYRNNVLYNSTQHAITVAAATGTAPQPGFVSQCISLYTNTPSRTARGRMYLPRTGNAPSASTFQWASIATVLGQLKTHLHNIETALAGLPGTSTTAQLSVVSRQGPPSAPVTLLRADSLPDTQHGRTRSMSVATLDTLSY